MKIFTFIIIFCLSVSLSYSLVEYKTDNGTLLGFFVNNTNWEESKTLKPPYPSVISKIKMYLGGTEAKKDTFWIVADPTDGYIPPSLFSHHISSYLGVVFEYDGKEGWKEIDISNLKLEAGGVNGFVVQHVIKQNGPYFGVDNQPQTANNQNSFLNDVYKPNPNFYNIRGTMYSLSPGNFMVRTYIDYKNSNSDGTYKNQKPDKMDDITAKAGLTDVNGSLIPSEMATVVDFNNDFFPDVVIKSNFFKNNGDGTFTNITSQINAPNNGTVWADVDNDGYMDFIAANGWKNDKIYYGNIGGTFTEDTDNTIKIDAPTVSPLWLDYNSDGLVDLFVAYGRKEENGQETYYQDKLFKNLGNRKFQEVTQEAGIAAGEPTPLDCWGATVTDYNMDGLPDIFVSTYRLAPDLLFRNNGNGTFTEVGASTGARGVATSNPQYFGHGMGSDWGDYDNDGDMDFAVGNLSHVDERALVSNKSLLMQNNGSPDFKFSNKTDDARLSFYEMNAGMVWADLNFDGYQDLVHAQYAYYAKGGGNEKNSRFYLNGGPDNNFRLSDMTYEFGSFVHGAWSPVRGDFDNDGDMDIIIASSNENLKLFDNQVHKQGNWISFHLIGSPANKVNTCAYGSSITVTAGGKKFYRILPGTQLNARASQSTNELNFGIGENTVESVEVKFSDGKKLVVDTLKTNAKYVVYWDGKVERIETYKVHLAAPLNDSKLSDNQVTFKWYPLDEVKDYWVDVSYSPDFSNLIHHFYTNDRTDTTLMNFDKDKNIYWRVATTKSGKVKWSDTWKFTISSNTDVDEDVINNNTDFIKISPQPAMDFIDIELSNILSESYDVSIIDLTGKIVYHNNQNNTQSCGLNLRINTRDLNSGLYHLRISDGKTIFGKQFNITR